MKFIILACLGILCSAMLNPAQGFTELRMDGTEKPFSLFRSVEPTSPLRRVGYSDDESDPLSGSQKQHLQVHSGESHP